MVRLAVLLSMLCMRFIMVECYGILCCILCSVVPGVVIEGLSVAAVCPSVGLRVEWSVQNPGLLGGPEQQVSYVLSSTSAPASTFPYNPLLTVRYYNWNSIQFGSFSSYTL